MDTAREHKLMQLLSDDPSMILLIKNKYLTDNMWLISLEKEPELFEYMKDPSENVCRMLLKGNGALLPKIMQKTTINITKDMVWDAVNSYPAVIFDLPTGLLNDLVVERALDLDPSLMTKMKNIKPEYISSRLKKNPGIIQYVNNPSDDLVCQAISLDPNICAHLKVLTPRVKAFIKENYPDIANMLIGFNTDN